MIPLKEKSEFKDNSIEYFYPFNELSKFFIVHPE
jgi:hypothetical protein